MRGANSAARPAARATLACAGLDDLPAIARLAREIWPACYSGIITAKQISFMLRWMYGARKMRSEVLDEGICYLTLSVGRKLVGYASYGPADDPAEMKLHKIYIHPGRQRAGLGRLLLRRVEKAAVARGFRRLVLTVNRHNRAAIAFYRMHGFRVSRKILRRIGHGFVMDDFLMAKPLRG